MSHQHHYIETIPRDLFFILPNCNKFSILNSILSVFGFDDRVDRTEVSFSFRKTRSKYSAWFLLSIENHVVLIVFLFG